MRLKSPHRPGGEAGQPGRSRSRLATLLAAGALTLGMTGYAAVLSAGPALADPTCQEVAVGSDTTQVVMDQYSVDLSSNFLCSYDATDPLLGPPATGAIQEISYEKGFNATEPSLSCPTMERPNGSTAGVTALRQSINPNSQVGSPLSPAPATGCIDIARSSSGPTSNTGGALTYIPFAEDAVAGSVGPTTGGVVDGIYGNVTTVATSITHANLFTETDLVNMYKNCAEVTEGGVTYWPLQSGGQPANTQQIDLYVPQAGSGTLKFWAQEMLGSSSDTFPTGCVYQTIQQGTLKGDLVEEHDGRAVGTDTDGYFPFSIANWIAQSTHTVGDPINLDRRYGAQLEPVTPVVNGVNQPPVSPFIGTIPNESLNPAFPYNREVYNVVEGCRVDSTAPLPFTGATCSIDSALVSMLVGQNGSLCQDELTILNYGYALLVNNSNEPDACGSIAPALRSVPPPV